MKQNPFVTLRKAISAHGNAFSKEVILFSIFFFHYSKGKTVGFSRMFEKNKNHLVKFFMMKRGRYNRPFLHLTTMGVLGLGVLIAPYIADTCYR